jgi:SAM-dependent methyltransferase
LDSKQRFSDRVETYIKYRPGYPIEALDYLYTVVGLNSGAIVADVGAGTGIFSSLLLERGTTVYAVEPNLEMREAAVQKLGDQPHFHAVDGSAEQTGLPDGTVDFIVCAQSFHWFDRAAAQREFRRILKPGGKVALLWNARLTEGTLFLEGYERLLTQYGTDYVKVNHRNISPEALRPFFREGLFTIAKFPNRQLFDFADLQGRLLSSSYSPLPGHPNYKPMIEALSSLFDRTQVNGNVSFDYQTEVFWGEV